MKLEGVDIFVASTIGGAAKIPAELRYSVEVRLLRRRRQIADRHVLDHTAAKSADLSHRKLLSEGLGCEKPTILSDGRRLLRPPLNCRASGFVQSPSRAEPKKALSFIRHCRTSTHARHPRDARFPRGCPARGPFRGGPDENRGVCVQASARRRPDARNRRCQEGSHRRAWKRKERRLSRRHILRRRRCPGVPAPGVLEG